MATEGRAKTAEQQERSQKQVFIVGSKGIPANYGGFETFVEKLTQHQKSSQIRYHVVRMSDQKGRFEYNGVNCINIKVPPMGPAKAVYYDLAGLEYCIQYCKNRPWIQNPVFYVLACRIGPFIAPYKRRIQQLGGTLYVNPDGHEWKREKWSVPVRRYWKFSERFMVKYADLLICDSKNIEQYILEEYKQYHPKTTYIAYGADTHPSRLRDDDPKYLDWMSKRGLRPNEYYLVVGRFVPENNYLTMLQEFMRSNTKKDFALITNVSRHFLQQLQEKTNFQKDSRIHFVGTVYDYELLKKIRENAYGYFHGHEVGGTNPSLLEALATTDLNLLLDVGFNREVAEDGAVYWTKQQGSLSHLIDQADHFTPEQIHQLGKKAKQRIHQGYTWDFIVDQYENLFLR